MAHFIKVTSQTRDGSARTHHVNVDDVIQTATDSRNGGCIITVRNSDYAIWSDESSAEVEALLVKAGATIYAL